MLVAPPAVSTVEPDSRLFTVVDCSMKSMISGRSGPWPRSVPVSRMTSIVGSVVVVAVVGDVGAASVDRAAVVDAGVVRRLEVSRSVVCVAVAVGDVVVPCRASTVVVVPDVVVAGQRRRRSRSGRRGHPGSSTRPAGS